MNKELGHIERTDYGFVQTASYANRDLFHEEVVELDSPFADIVRADTAVMSFLLIGDQNAGKSTFLHSFCHFNDPNYLELSAILPILSATFVNTRFLPPGTRHVLVVSILCVLTLS